MCIYEYMGVRKFGPFIYQNRAIRILSFKKRVYYTPGGAKEKGLFGTHIRTISYIGRYPPSPEVLTQFSKRPVHGSYAVLNRT